MCCGSPNPPEQDVVPARRAGTNGNRVPTRSRAPGDGHKTKALKTTLGRDHSTSSREASGTHKKSMINHFGTHSASPGDSTYSDQDRPRGHPGDKSPPTGDAAESQLQPPNTILVSRAPTTPEKEEPENPEDRPKPSAERTQDRLSDTSSRSSIHLSESGGEEEWASEPTEEEVMAVPMGWRYDGGDGRGQPNFTHHLSGRPSAPTPVQRADTVASGASRFSRGRGGNETY
ncbi:MAG: hypothetical protein M1839_005284 [Geoglossum umbratile]|nr:MAG: hypothetical protein M1839_005284 [Geoglossum umbratile]